VSFGAPLCDAAFLVAGIALSACSRKKTTTQPLVVPIASFGLIVPVSSLRSVDARTSRIVCNGAYTSFTFDQAFSLTP
jgi:hypothetical protein